MSIIAFTHFYSYWSLYFESIVQLLDKLCAQYEIDHKFSDFQFTQTYQEVVNNIKGKFIARSIFQQVLVDKQSFAKGAF